LQVHGQNVPVIEKPRRHENGSIKTMIGFSRNLNVGEM
jgi:hypothetical protein